MLDKYFMQAVKKAFSDCFFFFPDKQSRLAVMWHKTKPNNDPSTLAMTCAMLPESPRGGCARWDSISTYGNHQIETNLSVATCHKFKAVIKKLRFKEISKTQVIQDLRYLLWNCKEIKCLTSIAASFNYQHDRTYHLWVNMLLAKFWHRRRWIQC